MCTVQPIQRGEKKINDDKYTGNTGFDEEMALTVFRHLYKRIESCRRDQRRGWHWYCHSCSSVRSFWKSHLHAPWGSAPLDSHFLSLIWVARDVLMLVPHKFITSMQITYEDSQTIPTNRSHAACGPTFLRFRLELLPAVGSHSAHKNEEN